MTVQGIRSLTPTSPDLRVLLTPIPANERPTVVESVGEHESADAEKTNKDPLRTYLWLVVSSDLVAIIASVASAVFARFNFTSDSLINTAPHGLVALGIAAAWFGTLSLNGAYDRRFFGVGTEEFKRVLVATCILFGLVGTISFVLKAELSRAFILIVLPVGLLALITGRTASRAWLKRERSSGRRLFRTLLIGQPEQTELLAAAFAVDPCAGFLAVEQISPPRTHTAGWIDTVSAQIQSHHIRAVAISQSDLITDELIRRLAWQLEGRGIDLLVAPILGDISGPRLTLRPAAGLPLIHLDEPHLTGGKRFAKRILDVVGATVLLVITSPLLLVTAVMIRVTSRGPVIFKQRRVGLEGSHFTMWKFRTMTQDSELGHEQAVANAMKLGSNTTLRNDPRITKVGRLLRRWSLDEFPQFLNVILGSMSLVGPRPLLVSEANNLPAQVQRRHLTKPGLTGLWQISGRKGTTWDERMRLDLYFVENWSPALDTIILLKTAKAVLTGHGAY